MPDCVVVASAASRKALAVAFSVKKVLGLRVVGVFHKRHPYLYSRLFDEKVLAPSRREELEWAAAVLEAAAERSCCAVVPVDYVDVVSLSAAARAFERRGVALACPPHELAVKASRKDLLPELLKGAAETPRQVVVRSPRDAPRVYSLAPPLVVKGLGDASGPSYHLGHDSAAEEAARRAPCLVQEYAAGRARGYYAVAWRGEPLLEFPPERTVEYEPWGGPSLAARGPVHDPELYSLGRRVVARLEWTGPVMVETKWNPETGEYLVLEVNPKLWGSLDLPVHLGYHFPAVLVAAHLWGPERARGLASRLAARPGRFYWLLDALRYTAKQPGTWLAAALHHPPVSTDLWPPDPPRALAQLLAGLARLPRERRRWARELSRAVEQLRRWARELARRSRRGLLLILDLDGTLADLPVDWAEVRRELARKGMARPWETVSTALHRLWREDPGAYAEASKLVEARELEAAERAKPLLRDPEPLKRLRDLGAKVCVATKQALAPALRTLDRLGVRSLVDHVEARDSGRGPLKRELYRACTEALGAEGAVVVVDDNLPALVDAARMGMLSARAAYNAYNRAQALRLGIPAGAASELVKLVFSALVGRRA